MKVLVLGATGGVGIEPVKQAVARGHEVTALVRSPDRLHSWEQAIRMMKGDLLNQVFIEGALKNQVVVLSGFGPRLPIAKDEEDLLTGLACTRYHRGFPLREVCC